MKKIRVLYITNGINGSGGLERVLAVKASYMADVFKYNVHIASLYGGVDNLFFDFSDNINFHNINVLGGNIKFLSSYFKGIKSLIKEVEPDIISVCDDGPKGLLFPLVFGNRIPVVYERHAAKRLNFNKQGGVQKILNKLIHYTIPKFDSFIVLTKANCNDWPNISCDVIPNPSSFEIKDYKIEKEKVVIAVGSQTFNKGFDLLIDAWSIINKRHPGWQLKIFGRKDPQLELQEQINKLGLDNSISLYDPVKSIEEEYKKASIYALSSRTEGFGMVLIEAMSFATPCVSFDCPHGPGDIIKDGEDGFLIPNGDVEQFALAINELIENDKMRLSMGSRATDNVKRYSIDQVALLWHNLFKKVVNGKSITSGGEV